MINEYNDDFFAKVSDWTYRKCIDKCIEHAALNKKYIKKSIKHLSIELSNDGGKPALVVSGGPSLHANNHIQALKEEGFSGRIVAADGSMGHCLRHGIVPDYVLTVDPDPHRIIRWFGDPRLNERPEDDYFHRQDIDPELRENELKRNEETIALVNRYGPQIKLIISTSVTPEITERALQAGMELYWWTPLYDDFALGASASRRLCQELKVPCMTTGGNVGSSCWAFAQAVLRSDPVLMVGMDFSYPPGTDVYHTQYYDVLKELYPDDPARGLISVYNPHLGQEWRTDPAYYWYAECFRKMLPAAGGKSINCTEGGILFGEGIAWKPFRQALRELN